MRPFKRWFSLFLIVCLFSSLLAISIGAASGDTIVYITRTGSKYHSSGCQYLSQSCYSIALADAVAKGYGRCSRCGPPTLTSGSSNSSSSSSSSSSSNDAYSALEKKYDNLEDKYEDALEDVHDLKATNEDLDERIETLKKDNREITEERNAAKANIRYVIYGAIAAVILVIVIADAKSSGMKRQLKQVSNSLSQSEADRKAAEAARDRAYIERDNAARQRTNALLELNRLAKQWEALEHRNRLALNAGEQPLEPDVSEIDTSNISCREMARVPDDILFDNDYWPLIVNGESTIVYVNKAGTRYHKRECRCSVGATAENVYRVRPECEPCRFCEPIVVQGKPGWLIDYQSFIKKKIENGFPDPDIPFPKN